MERGVYFDAWFPHQHCYHPSLPPRRLKMLEDLEDYHATMLVWSALGGGSISLPYLEQEAWQEIDPRFRFYGYLNDAEFIARCQERGIKVFGVVFEAQGWEFPVELSEEGDRVLAMNELRGAGQRGWLGLREFTQNTHPKLWKPLEHYFPDGLVNSDGQRVTDILEECTSRDIHGRPCHARWVEAPDREHYSYLMDRNNPVWREYLKAIIRIQIDAGVAGVQLDEADFPMWAIDHGGCFCKDCMKQFRAYLQGLAPEERPKELEDADLDTFHYGAWLLERGHDFSRSEREAAPLFWDYIRFQRHAMVGHFAELADYIKEYGRSAGREVLVSGNLYYLSPHFYPFEQKTDVLITEMNQTSYRQPVWCRYAAGFAGGKPVIVVENPFGGVGPELLPKLQRGKGYDLFRMMQYEAAALGINMSVPYGAWMGAVIEDSFWAPHEVVLEIQDFIATHDRLYPTDTLSEVAVAFSARSAHDWLDGHGWSVPFPFWAVGETLVAQHQPFDVVMLPDGVLREDALRPEDLARYRRTILPECTFLTPAQVAAIRGYLDGGGRVLAIGALGLNLDPSDRARLRHPHLVRIGDASDDALVDDPQVRVAPSVDLAINIVRPSDKEAAIHLIRYDYDETRDEVPVLGQMRLHVRLPRPFRNVLAFSPTSDVRARITYSREERELHRIDLEDVSLYTALLLR